MDMDGVPNGSTALYRWFAQGFQRFIEESECHLAVSLHSPVALQRRELMPAENFLYH